MIYKEQLFEEDFWKGIFDSLYSEFNKLYEKLYDEYYEVNEKQNSFVIQETQIRFILYHILYGEGCLVELESKLSKENNSKVDMEVIFDNFKLLVEVKKHVSCLKGRKYTDNLDKWDDDMNRLSNIDNDFLKCFIAVIFYNDGEKYDNLKKNLTNFKDEYKKKGWYPIYYLDKGNVLFNKNNDTVKMDTIVLIKK